MITMQPLAGASASSVATRSPTSMHLLFPLSSFRPLPRSEVGVPVSCVPVAASRRQQPPRIRCQAASTAPSTLSSRFGTGTLPGGAIPFRLLQDALPTLVRSLSQAPLLLLTSAPGMEKIVSIPRTVDASDDKTWEHYASLLREEHPSLYIFAEEVVCGGDNCVLNRPSTPHAMQSLSPVPTTTQCAEELRDETAPRLSGRLGDCCDEDEEDSGASAAAAPSNNIVPLLAAQHQQQRCSHEPVRASVRFWGLVVRAASHTDPVEGCYLLKTSENADASGCTCIHYSLTKVKRGESLYEQLVQSWLV